MNMLDAEANSDAFRGGEETQASDTDFLNSEAYSFKRYSLTNLQMCCIALWLVVVCMNESSCFGAACVEKRGKRRILHLQL